MLIQWVLRVLLDARTCYLYVTFSDKSPTVLTYQPARPLPSQPISDEGQRAQEPGPASPTLFFRSRALREIRFHTPVSPMAFFII